MEKLVVSEHFCNPLDNRALSKCVFPVSRLCPTVSDIHSDFPLFFHLLDTSAFVGINSTENLQLPNCPSGVVQNRNFVCTRPAPRSNKCEPGHNRL